VYVLWCYAALILKKYKAIALKGDRQFWDNRHADELHQSLLTSSPNDLGKKK
jgi:hypothetical protein